VVERPQKEERRHLGRRLGLSHRFPWWNLCWCLPGLLLACSPDAPTPVTEQEVRAPEIQLFQAWSGIAEDGSRLLVEPLGGRAGESRDPAIPTVPGELSMAREAGIIAEDQSLLRVTWVPGSAATLEDWREVQVSTPSGDFGRFGDHQLEALSAELQEVEATRLRLYWYGVVQGEYLNPVEQAVGLSQSTPVLSEHHCLVFGPNQAVPADASLTGKLGSRSIVLQPRQWTPRQRRHFLAGTAPSSNE